MKETLDALHKINNLFLKILNINTLDIDICSQNCALIVYGQVMEAATASFGYE